MFSIDVRRFVQLIPVPAVIDSLAHAREFHQAIGLTGLIVTKLDGSGKGGIVIAIQDELGLPTRFVGTGEKLEDLAPFDGRDFIANMI